MADEYKEWKIYFDLCEKDMRSNPTHYRYQKAFYRVGKPLHGKDVLFFPVEIMYGRLSFGKVQFLITPFGMNKGVLGERWVERKMLVMVHDRNYKHLDQSVLEE